MPLLELVGRQVGQTRMRSNGIVVAPPLLDHNLRFRARSKPFKAQAFISELAVEALVRAVLPRLAGIADLAASRKVWMRR